jgi:hypothetical protein
MEGQTDGGTAYRLQQFWEISIASPFPPGLRSSLVQVLICRQVSVDGGMSAFLKGQSYLPWGISTITARMVF